MRLIDADELIELIDSYIKTSNQVERSDSFVDGMKDGYYRIRSRILNMPTAQPEHLTDDDFETIRIHLSAFKESLCNQRRWKEAEDYERLISRFMSFASAQPERKRGRWIYGEDNLGTGRDGWFCSECGHFEVWDYSADMKSAELNLPNYCPNCGADMRGETDE